MSCCICLDETDKRSRVASNCPSCGTCVCRPCLETYLLADESGTPVCPTPSCRATWTPTFLYSTLKTTFRTGAYQKHREKILFDREKARLPETQEDAKRYREAREAIGPLVTRLNVAKRLYPTRPEVLERNRQQQKIRKDLNVRMNALRKSSAEYGRLTKSFREIQGSEGFARETDEYTRGGTRGPLVRQYQETHIAIRAMDETFMDQSNTWYREMSQEPAMVAAEAAVAPFRSEIDLLQRQIYPLNHVVRFFGQITATAATATATAVPVRTFVMKCPQSVCEGFLTAEYKCGLCEVEVCSDCHVPKLGAHACDPATVETIKQIRKEARSCPSCTALISKIDGCDQMWCTQCKTAFSWRTGQIETRVIHNPHYFQFMRESGQAMPRRYNPGFGCEAVHGIMDTLQALHTRFENKEPILIQMMNYYRHILHIREVDLMRHRREAADYTQQEWRRVLRVRRLVNEMDDVKWKRTLQQKEKAHYKVSDWIHLLEMYTTTSLETLARLPITATLEDIHQTSVELATLKEYTLTQAKAISKLYGCVLPECLRALTGADTWLADAADRAMAMAVPIAEGKTDRMNREMREAAATVSTTISHA